MLTSSRHRDDRPISTGWVLPVSALTLLLILGGSGVTLADLFVGDDARESTVALRGAAQTPAPTAAVPSPRASPSESELVAAARRVKPLEDIEKGDRVIYQGHVCVWLLWNKNINTSTIRCRGARAFQIQTGRLTPVERKDGASKLKVEH